jgi:hypothetical protein
MQSSRVTASPDIKPYLYQQHPNHHIEMVIAYQGLIKQH